MLSNSARDDFSSAIEARHGMANIRNKKSRFIVIGIFGKDKKNSLMFKVYHAFFKNCYKLLKTMLIMTLPFSCNLLWLYRPIQSDRISPNFATVNDNLYQ